MSEKIRFNRKRGRNYLCEPTYKIPENISLKIVLLALIASRIEWTYDRLSKVWAEFVPHPKSYNMMTRYIKELKRSSSVEKPERGVVKVTLWGLKKLKYYDKKVGLPEVLREPIDELLDELDED